MKKSLKALSSLAVLEYRTLLAGQTSTLPWTCEGAGVPYATRCLPRLCACPKLQLWRPPEQVLLLQVRVSKSKNHIFSICGPPAETNYSTQILSLDARFLGFTIIDKDIELDPSNGSIRTRIGLNDCSLEGSFLETGMAD